MFKVRLFTCHEFGTIDEAIEFLEFLNQAGDIFKPTRFDYREPVRQVYQPTKLNEPAEFLAGAPDFTSGDIFLKSGKFGFLAWIKWGRARLVEWYMQLDDKYFRQPSHAQELIEFLSELCRKFPVVYGGAAPAEDWDAKHWLVQEDEEGEMREKLGLSLDNCLPGLYWLTLMGDRVVQHFGKNKLKRLPVERLIDLGKSGVALVLRHSPYTGDVGERLRSDAEIIRSLGSQYFFEIGKPSKKCQAIAKVT